MAEEVMVFAYGGADAISVVRISNLGGSEKRALERLQEMFRADGLIGEEMTVFLPSEVLSEVEEGGPY